MKLGSLFDGSGGFPLAGAHCGITPVWASEIEPYPIAVTKNRFPNMKHLGDISKINGAEIEPVDIITFGSPCQDLSVAGLRKGLSGERSGLYVQAVRIAAEMFAATNGEFPKFCIFENVPGMLSSNAGNDFKAALDMLQDLGFIPDTNMLDAQYMGVPQRRLRVFIPWANLNYILPKKTNLSDSITLQLLTELLQINLVELLKVCGVDRKKSAVLGLRTYEDGLMRRMKLFSLHKESRLQMLQERLDEMQAMSSEEQKSSDSIRGEDRTDRLMLTIEDTLFPDLTEEDPCMSIGQLLRQALEDGSQVMNEFITSTWTKETIDSKICFYLTALHHTLGVTTRLMQSLEKTAPKSLNYYEWALYILTEMRGFINAAQKNEKSSGHMGWHDILRNIECDLHSYREQVERYLANECTRKILPQFQGLRGHLAESGTPWQATSRNAESCVGTTDREGKGESNITAYSFDSLSSNSMKSSNPHSGCREVDIAKCLDTTNPCPSKNQGGIAVVVEVPYTLLLDDQGGQQISVRTDGKSPTLRAEMHGNVPCVMDKVYSVENHPADSRVNIDDSGKVQTLTSRMGTGGGNVPLVMESAVVYAVDQGGGKSGANFHEEKSPTLTCTHGGEPVIAFDRAAFNQGVNAQYDFEVTDSGINSTLVAKGPSGVAYKEQETKYIVRRLTPTECARLQGFPDWWGHFPEKEDLTDEEYAFWLEVRNTHAEINGKTVKEYTKEQMVKWYNKLHTDSAEYKCWGNGISLPPVLCCMQGIAEVLRERVMR